MNSEHPSPRIRAALAAEDIVRALAALESPTNDVDGGDIRCGLCYAPWDTHLRGCPWRMARNWLAANREGASDGSPSGSVEPGLS